MLELLINELHKGIQLLFLTVSILNSTNHPAKTFVNHKLLMGLKVLQREWKIPN